MPDNLPTRAAMLPELLENLGIADIPTLVVKGVSADSRNLQKDYAFVALQGDSVNGRDFVAQAAMAGAAVILMDADDGPWLGETGIPVMLIPGLRCMLGRIAARFYGDPSRGIWVVGVTGTNGKTSVAYLLTQALDALGRKAAMMGTLGVGLVGQLKSTGFTTPDAIELQRLLRELRDQGVDAVCMEVSSHGLDQCRVDGVAFDGAVFTNLTRDHLDYHGDMAHYAKAKTRLFEDKHAGFAVINQDDKYASSMKAAVGEGTRIIEYGMESADVHVLKQLPSGQGLHLVLQTPVGECELRTRLIGHFNIYNLMAVVSVLVALDVSIAEIQALAFELRPAPGRMEVFGNDASPMIVVDYAHTPDALKQVLAATREHTDGKLWCVFGCGGDRDVGKRPLMGKMAEMFADEVVLTDDNPRGEDAGVIVRDIIGGMRREPTVVQDRKAAIHWALSRAGTTDAVVIAGKGHESVQLVGDQALPFSDRQVVEEWLGRAA